MGAGLFHFIFNLFKIKSIRTTKSAPRQSRTFFFFSQFYISFTQIAFNYDLEEEEEEEVV